VYPVIIILSTSTCFRRSLTSDFPDEKVKAKRSRTMEI
jgi:hypothetical protein